MAVMRHTTPPAPAGPSNKDAAVSGQDAIVGVSDLVASADNPWDAIKGALSGVGIV